MDAKKALIITWVIIGLLIAGAIGFYIGRSDIGRGLNNLNNINGPGQNGPQGEPGGKSPLPQPIIQK